MVASTLVPRRKKADEGKPPRNDITVKLDAEVAKIARANASLRGMSLAEYLSEVVQAVAVKEFEETRLKMPRRPSSGH